MNTIRMVHLRLGLAFWSAITDRSRRERFSDHRNLARTFVSLTGVEADEDFTRGENPERRVGATFRSLVFEKSAVLSHHQVVVNLLHEVKGNTHRDEQRSSTVKSGDDGVDIQKS